MRLTGTYLTKLRDEFTNTKVDPELVTNNHDVITNFIDFVTIKAYGDRNVEEPKTIGDWSREIHQVAIDHGWWEGGERDIAEQLLNMVSELIEAWDQYVLGREITEVWYSDCEREGTKGKPEGFGIELADCMIRLLDTLGSIYGPDKFARMIAAEMKPILADILQFHGELARVRARLDALERAADAALCGELS